MPKYYHYGARHTINNVKKIDLAWLNKNGHLYNCPNKNISWFKNSKSTGNINIKINIESKNPHIKLNYRSRKYSTNNSDWKLMNYKIDLVSMPCNFGGRRWFFKCCLYRNGKHCKKTVRILYQVNEYFGCRRCADLSYDSCNKSSVLRNFPYQQFYYVLEAEKYHKENIKIKYYKGKPTKKYRRYLKLLKKTQGFNWSDIEKNI